MRAARRGRTWQEVLPPGLKRFRSLQDRQDLVRTSRPCGRQRCKGNTQQRQGSSQGEVPAAPVRVRVCLCLTQPDTL